MVRFPSSFFLGLLGRVVVGVRSFRACSVPRYYKLVSRGYDYIFLLSVAERMFGAPLFCNTLSKVLSSTPPDDQAASYIQLQRTLVERGSK